MYHHIKKLMYTVRVDEPDPRFGNMLLEQFGGANGELAAAMQYSIQGLNCEDPARKDLLMDIGTEELSHLEIVGTLARMHLKPTKFNREQAEADPLIAIAGGGGVNLFNSQGNAWTADYLKITGELDVDLRSNIAAEARAKIVYERLINITDDPGIKEALGFLMTREIAHQKSFEKALYAIEDNFPPGKLPGIEKFASVYVNTSQGEGDTTGPWNSGEQWDRIDDLEQTMPIDGGDGIPSVTLDSADQAVATKMAKRTMSDPSGDPLTGADLGAGPGAGRTTNGDKGGAPDIESAPAMAEANAPA